MTMDPLALLTEVDAATDRLLHSVRDLDADALRAPSLLPGWTRGHVLTHVARNAEAYTNLLTWARTGTPHPAYPSREARDAAIEAGHGRSLAQQVADVRATHERFADAAAAMPAAAWAFVLPDTGRSAAALPWARLREVEVHHADLAVGYGPADWPEAFALRLLREVAADLDGPPMVLRPAGLEHPLHVGDPAGAPTVLGTTRALAAWLTGRGDGAELTVSPDGELPVPGRWR